MFALRQPSNLLSRLIAVCVLPVAAPALAADGAAIYAQSCANCHGPELEGSESAGALVGRAFRERWPETSLDALRIYTQTTMPIDGPGSLADAEYHAIVNLIAGKNGYRVAPPPPEKPGLTVEWLHHRGDPGSTNYSPLSLINADNVGSLRIAWRWKSDNFGATLWPNLQTTPIMAGGVLYATVGARRSVVAIDAQTGETLWMHRIDEGARGTNAPRKGPGRGVALRRTAGESTVYFITPGFQLVALDARDGRRRVDFGTNGVVDLKASLGYDAIDARIGSSSPPLLVGDVLVVGAAFPAGSAPPSRAMPRGNISAYDAGSGEQLWVFDTVPQPGQHGHDTWQQESWSYTGNTGAWAPMSADPDLGFVYIPVEAATGDFYGGHRPGDNLFSQSLLCLDAKSGVRVWHFQTVHHGIWDYDLPAPPVLLDVKQAGAVIPAVLQVTKQGFVFAFDRRDGTPLWPIHERPVPASRLPGEQTSATQPIPSRPAPFTQQGVSDDTLNNLTPEVFAEAKRIASRYAAGPLYTPPSAISDSNGGTLMLPAAAGGGNWQGGVADPESGMLYVSATNTIGVAAMIGNPERSDMRYVASRVRPEKPFGLPLNRPPWGTITAIDMNTGDHLWQVANGDTPDYVRNHPMLESIELPRTGHNDRAGLLVTQSLLFAGEGAGMYVANEGGTRFRAHDKTTGAIVAEIDLGARQSGLPMTYAVDGRQYIVVAAGLPGQGGEFIALTVDD